MNQFLTRLKFPFLLLLMIWVVEIYEFLYNKSFTTWGILPRKIEGLSGILTSPFIHSDFDHLISNSVPLFTLSAIMVVFYKRVAVASFVIIYLLTGSMVWLFARHSYIVGASGVVYGLASFVLFAGIFRRNVKSIVLSLVVLTVYSSFLAGIIPSDVRERVSWESHLFGSLVGIFVAYLFKNVKEADEEEKVNPWADEEEGYYFDREVFDKTKVQRAREEQLRKEAIRQQQVAERQRKIAEEMAKRNPENGGWYTTDTNL